ncbi:lantibiotic dehydratase [Nocardiopsis gilva]|uniref:lantibiotic dehydratase n=1 Tax=Nocardiopsis gilva TaxID=280236 RepID=UPI00034AE196|nr:lantibiotic dehydratase [Nocardiopsis gilva]
MSKRSPYGYRWSGAAQLRASTTPHDLTVPHDPFDDASITPGREWLASVWEREEVRDALATVNPALCDHITTTLSRQDATPRRVRKTVLSLVAYLLRWQRPTPLATFAGVASLSIGDHPDAVRGTDHRIVARPDSDWLSDVIDRLHGCRALLERLRVVTDNTGHVRGERFVTSGHSADGQTHLAAPEEVSISHSPPVAAALDAARTPVPYAQLRDLLAQRFPKADPARIMAMLDDLIAHRVLLTSLWAPMTRIDALGHVCEELAAANAQDIDEIADVVERLEAIHRQLIRPTPTTLRERTAPVIDQMHTLTGIAPTPLTVDTIVDCQVRLPHHVVRAAEEAADVLTRLSSHPFGAPPWRDYHARFRERYGPGALVPVLDLVSDSGLGLPAGYLGSGRGRTPRPLTDRDTALLALVQRAMAKGSDEIVLTEPLIDELAPEDDVLTVPRVELCGEIHAATLHALAEGDFSLVVTAAPRPTSSMAGRFAHLLPDDDQQRLAASYHSPQPDTLVAQLSFPPRKRRNANIARTTRLLPWAIPLAEHHSTGPDVIPLSDLAVTADARHFHLLRISTGQRVEAHVTHALEPATHTPPLARFLAEITHSRCAAYGPFDFGAAAHLPYLPRVRYNTTILSAARWLLDADNLPRATAPTPEWEESFTRWRRHWRVPDQVALVEHDRRLPLNLSHPVHRRLLRQRLGTHDWVELREAAAPEQMGWLGHPHEALFTLTRPEPITPPPLIPLPVRPVSTQEAHLPGGDVVHAQLYAHPQRFDEIITAYLPELGCLLHARDAWWFHRHCDMTRRDTDQYLAFYLRVPPALSYGQAVETVHTWAQDLRRHRLLSRLALAPSQPQTGRYGYGPALQAAEEVFAADSAAAVAQIRAARRSHTAPQPLAAASMVDLVTSFTDHGLQWLSDDMPHTAGPVDQSLRRQALHLAAPDGDRTALYALNSGDEVAAAWQTRAAALADYHKHLASERDPHTVLRSLLHLHHVRALGVSPNQETLTIRTARVVARSHTARTAR